MVFEWMRMDANVNGGKEGEVVSIMCSLLNIMLPELETMEKNGSNLSNKEEGSYFSIIIRL